MFLVLDYFDNNKKLRRRYCIWFLFRIFSLNSKRMDIFYRRIFGLGKLRLFYSKRLFLVVLVVSGLQFSKQVFSICFFYFLKYSFLIFSSVELLFFFNKIYKWCYFFRVFFDKLSVIISEFEKFLNIFYYR